VSRGAAAVREAAPAKLNLFLHIIGRRRDGMHLIDSLVVFAELGDVVTVAPADSLSLTRAGPMAADLPPVEDDLVFQTATRLAAAAGAAAGAAIEVQKNLPVASGIGGGSADAAAAIRGLSRLWQIDLPPERLSALAQELGADVAVCLESKPARVGGIGERLSPADPLAPLYAVLVNPRIAVATAEVFAAYAAGPQAAAAELENGEPWSREPEQFAQQLAAYRNDLSAAAMSLCPAIADVLAALDAQPACLLARLSGSGATCFGLFATPADAQAAAAALARDHPDWWVAATALDTGGD
jgi:4-diphosphocytidyl-2-C-methyl-D-erythritol kinase